MRARTGLGRLLVLGLGMNCRTMEAQGQHVPSMPIVPFEQFLELVRRLRATRALDLGQPLVKS